ncbi:hypothetical protein TIFTF001_025219 [Ficus carica]|uniref:Uncharacterized protein n=1 Tax=Ficus carica TaxID=3494 RepID=A0AA88AMM0_FICCA|nr:hypothetical protein TIFTF001_025219 [Ficus carica]
MLDTPSKAEVITVDRGKVGVEEPSTRQSKSSPDEGGVSSAGGRENPNYANPLQQLEMSMFDGDNPESRFSELSDIS